MCKPDKKILFCTCSDIEALSSPKEHIWVLRQFIKSENKGIRGKVKAPVSQLGNKITVEKILATLEEGNPFDFDYAPAEKDCITIYHQNNFLSVIYQNGAWQEGRHPAFSTVSKVVSKGKVKRKKVKS